ncbi:UDP-glycosyltransferase UGT5-like [Tribolium madens]|uniref:UDP-glycosyltransferase UGT5-like n=1 Tax=Tribolium madens TaxID=41895 RepID=UPI001CF76672|nr:UDP-glycosyltransferase UGT5-like [Tribolium madens]
MLLNVQRLFLLFIVVLFEQNVFGANILAINTLLSPSHHLFNDVYLFELAKKGHNVTLLGHDKNKHHYANYTHIIMEGAYEKVKDQFDLMTMKDMDDWETIKSMWTFAEITCLLDQKTEGLKQITKYPNDFKFDLIIVDVSYGHCLYPLIEKFGNPPIIGVNPFINQPNLFRNIWQSYIPFITHSFGAKISFWQKLKSVVFMILLEVTRLTHYIPRQQELAENYFGPMKSSILEIEKNMSLMLINYNPIFNYVEALPPNMIPIGGLHIQPKRLPDDLKKILDNEKSGAILFSLGSNVRSKELGQERIQAIIKTFSKLKQTVIWKFENDHLEGLPKNVHVRKWVPQNDILGHPNTILFISHGGLLSSHEIMYNGVPVIGIPFFLDQLQNVETFIAKGVGEKLSFSEITEHNLFNVIQKVLNNSSYMENAKKWSLLYKYQMNKPLDTAIFWTEYILKFKTAKHLNLATRNMNFIESVNLDLVFIFLLFLLLVVIIIFCTINLIFKCIKRKYVTKKLEIKKLL